MLTQCITAVGDSEDSKPVVIQDKIMSLRVVTKYLWLVSSDFLISLTGNRLDLSAPIFFLFALK